MRVLRHFRWLLGMALIFMAACAPLGTAQPVTNPALRPNATSTPYSVYLPAAHQSNPQGVQPTLRATPTLSPTAIISPTSHSEYPLKTHKIFDLAYTHTNGVEPYLQSLDVYYTDPITANHPVVIYVHGGGWTSGDKAHLDFKPEFFLKAGYVFVSINYRLSPHAKFPAHVQDVAAAIAWATQKIGQFGGDPNRLYISGHSAGGHLATLVATDERYLNAYHLNLSAIKGVVSIDTAGYDLSIFASRCKNHLLPEPYSSTFGQSPADWQQASPVTYIQSGKHIPPMALIYSGDVGIGSEVLREQMANEFGEKLSAALVTNQVFGAREKNHDEINAEFGKPGDPVSIQTLAFLQRLQATP